MPPPLACVAAACIRKSNPTGASRNAVFDYLGADRIRKLAAGYSAALE
jgi:hypothetical protein